MGLGRLLLETGGSTITGGKKDTFFSMVSCGGLKTQTRTSEKPTQQPGEKEAYGKGAGGEKRVRRPHNAPQKKKKRKKAARPTLGAVTGADLARAWYRSGYIKSEQTGSKGKATTVWDINQGNRWSLKGRRLQKSISKKEL